MWAYDRKAQFHLPNSRPKGPISKGGRIESSPFKQRSLPLAITKHETGFCPTPHFGRQDAHSCQLSVN